MSGYLRGMCARATSLTRHGAFGAAFLFAVVCQTVSAATPLTKLRQETRELLREEAVLNDGPAKDQAIAALCDLYVVLHSDERFATSDMLQGDAAKVRRRLLGIAHSRESQLKRDKIERPTGLSTKVDSAVAAALAEDATIGELLEPRAGQGGGAVPDHGWQLVDLIQRIVSPDFWEPQGGPGVIRYFAMRRVLVVRATTDVHEQIKDLLTALR